MQVSLAPMEGVTGYIVRNAFHHNFPYIDHYFTPFIPAAKRLSPKLKRELDPSNNQEVSLTPQLISNRSEEVLDMIRQLKDLGYTRFNLNLGCPSGTVVSGNRGSGLLRNPEALDQLLDEIYSRIDVPLSLKTRIGFNELGEWPELLKIYARYQVSELIIHPRLRRELYSGVPHLEAFAQAYDLFCSSQKQSLLCYNGDLWDMNHYQAVTEQFPGIDSVMIGRGLLARPYLSGQIKGVCLSQEQIIRKIRDFCSEIYDGYAAVFTGEKDAVIHMKEIWINLGKSFEGSEKPVKKLLKNSSPAQYKILADQILELPLKSLE